MNFEETLAAKLQEAIAPLIEKIDQLESKLLQQNHPAILTVDEAAEILKMGRPAVYELSHRIDFPVIRDGRKVRIPYQGLMRWIEQNSKKEEAI